mgnify:CR=1 FL=1
MQTIKCFEVWGHTDIIEGRGPRIVVARFASLKEAKKYVMSKEYAKWCVMGYQSFDRDIDNITVDELGLMEKESLKAKALAKLTMEERESLGLK